MTTLRHPRVSLRSADAGVVLAALGAAAVLGALLAQSLALGLALLAAICFLPVVLVDVALATSVWVALIFLAGFPHMESLPNRVLLLVGVGWVGVLARRSRTGRPSIPTGRTMLALLGAFAAWQALTLLWAPVAGDGEELVKGFLYICLGVVIVLSTIVEPRHARWLAIAFVAGAVLSVVWGIAEGGLSSGASGPAISDTERRFQAGAGDPNYLAAVIVPAIMLAGGLAARRSALWRAALAAAVAVLALGLTATQSRGGLLAAVVASLTALVIWRRQRLVIASLIGVLVVVAMAWFAANPAAWERVRASNGGNGRADVWQVAWRVTRDHPVVGVGLAQFPNVSPGYVRRPGALEYAGMIVDERKVVHNVYLQLWAETGIVGLGLFLALAGTAVAAAWQATVRFDSAGDADMAALSRATLLALVAILAAAFFLSNLEDRRLWVLFALASAIAAMARRQAPRSPSPIGR